MDSLFEFNGYYIAIVIISIVGFAISIALSFYFIYLPATRIETEFDRLTKRGRQALTNINNLITTTTNISQEVLEDTCNSVIYISNTLFGSPIEIDPDTGIRIQGCIGEFFPLCSPTPPPLTDNIFIPSICYQFLPCN